ncbi:MAG: Fe-S cluster assembly protein SufD [Chitinophagaceae bacterium]|nr:MAG: Fe-S cluster assembly protein SufD [Chitinophagaceae bacterium]
MKNTDNFLKEIDLHISQTKDASEEIDSIRNNGLNLFKEKGLPTLKNEEWKYTDVRKFLDHSFKFKKEAVSQEQLSDIIPEYLKSLEAYYIVLVNGKPDFEISNLPDVKGIHILSLKKALADKNPVLKERFNTLSDEKEESFSALNSAFLEDGLFVHIEKNVRLEKPLFVVEYGKSKESNSFFTSRNFIYAEESAEASLIWLYKASEEGKEIFCNELNEVFISDNADIKIDRLQVNQDKFRLVSSNFFALGRDSRMHTFSYNLGGTFSRNNFDVKLNGENGYAALSGVFLSDNNALIDNHILISHMVPNCISDQLFKGILKDKAQGVFNGKIYVERDAQKTAAYQNNKNLLLSEGAGIYTKPQLEIYADDVKCSHGATTGQIDENALFYLRTRGMNKNEARTILTLAFAKEAIEKVNNQALVEVLGELAEKKLNN